MALKNTLTEPFDIKSDVGDWQYQIAMHWASNLWWLAGTIATWELVKFLWRQIGT